MGSSSAAASLAMDFIVAFYNITWDRGRFQNSHNEAWAVSKVGENNWRGADYGAIVWLGTPGGKSDPFPQSRIQPTRQPLASTRAPFFTSAAKLGAAVLWSQRTRWSLRSRGC